MGPKRLKGMLDILPPESEKINFIVKSFEKIAQLHNFSLIRTPILEPAELFYHSTGLTSDIVNKEMYTFYDKKQRLLALRPEGTPGVIRAIIENNLKLPQRFYYVGPMFRYERPQKGRLREHYQLGLEIVGEKSPYSDFELIEIAHHFFSEIELKDTLTLVNSIGCEKCRPQFKAVFLEYLKDKENLLCPDCQERKRKNPLRIFDCKNENCQKILKASPKVKDFLCLSCKNHFEKFLFYLKNSGIPYQIDENLVRGLDYYTKTTFEFISQKLGKNISVGGGGRYDNLMKELGGNDAPCVGFALGLERIYLAKENPPTKKEKVMIVYDCEESFLEGENLAKILRKENIPCYLNPDFFSLKKQLKIADRLNFKYVIIVGEREREKGVYLLKDMETGNQEAIKKEELIERLKAVFINV
jgi:histidyl-tRNA synthetase|uniref:Histidine--tRNA ligase n=1 Tax=candidate division WOR-3 bacterium TaxID=2052148 RepID=A0A7V5XYW0_UNCW3